MLTIPESHNIVSSVTLNKIDQRMKLKSFRTDIRGRKVPFTKTCEKRQIKRCSFIDLCNDKIMSDTENEHFMKQNSTVVY